MADDSAFKIVDPDQAMLAQLKAKRVDTTAALPVGIRLDFDPQVARQAAADLILAGYPSVRLEMESTPAVIATVHMVLTRDSLSSLRARLTRFADARGAENLRQVMTFNGGLGFASEQAAREAGAALIAEGYPEVNVV